MRPVPQRVLVEGRRLVGRMQRAHLIGAPQRQIDQDRQAPLEQRSMLRLAPDRREDFMSPSVEDQPRVDIFINRLHRRVDQAVKPLDRETKPSDRDIRSPSEQAPLKLLHRNPLS